MGRTVIGCNLQGSDSGRITVRRRESEGREVRYDRTRNKDVTSNPKSRVGEVRTSSKGPILLRPRFLTEDLVGRRPPETKKQEGSGHESLRVRL